MNIFSGKPHLLAIIPLLFLVPAIAYADDDSRSNAAVTLGWIAIGSGMIANLSLVAFKIARRLPVAKLVGGYDSPSSLAPFYKPVLDFHIMLNSIGFFAGMMHGLVLVRGLDYVSLSLAIVMTFSMASGIILRYTHGRNAKAFGRLAHGQIILSILLLALVVLHVLLMQGNMD